MIYKNLIIKNSCKVLIIFLTAILQIYSIIFGLTVPKAHASSNKTPDFSLDNIAPPGYLSLGMGDVHKNQQIQWPEYYIDPTVNYGLNRLLPQSVRKGLELNAGYDRWEGLPTLQMDYFLSLKGWNDKSIFFSPRLSLMGTRETFSIGGGFRHLVTSELLVGFHAFHDWVRPRRFRGEFLKEAGVGFEVSALPGYHTDISLRFNAYLPINQRRTMDPHSMFILDEALPGGGDATIGVLLPPLLKWADLRIDGTAHSYRAENTDVTGYRFGFSMNSRNGMFRASVQHVRDNANGAEFRLDGGLTLAFDWAELLKGNQPFSAPYAASEARYDRKMRDSLFERIVRKHDLPADRSERPIALAAVVARDTVSFKGGFPDLPNSRVTVQISRSPWRDCLDIITDARGDYAGRFVLPPGKCKMRVIHKPTGQVSESRTIVVAVSY